VLSEDEIHLPKNISLGSRVIALKSKMVSGRWDMLTSGLFLLFLQLCGINFSAALLFPITE
jgi:uncharacterized membrane protein